MDRLINAANASSNENKLPVIKAGSPIEDIGDVIYDYHTKYYPGDDSGFIQGFAKVKVEFDKVYIEYEDGTTATSSAIKILALIDNATWDSQHPGKRNTINGKVYIYGYDKDGVIAIGYYLAGQSVVGFSPEATAGIQVYVHNKIFESNRQHMEEVITIKVKNGIVHIEHNSIGATRRYDLKSWSPVAFFANFIEDELVPESPNFKYAFAPEEDGDGSEDK